MVFKKDKEGNEGIGVLIIFIAMILVAAVAAGVLIQTASSLQSKSLDVGRQSQEKVTTDIDVVSVSVGNVSDHYINTTDYFVITIRLGIGSVPIKMADMIIKLDTMQGSQTLNYDPILSSTTNYNATYLSNNGDAISDGYLSNGDFIEIRFNPSRVIGEQESFELRVLSKNGALRPVYITTPSSMTNAVVRLYP